MMLEAKAPAKINLCLHVGPRRPDGYHPVCSLMEKIDIFDSLKAERTEAGISVRGSGATAGSGRGMMSNVEGIGAGGAGIPASGKEIPLEENTVYRAARALEAETGQQLPVEFELRKEIPVAAGLGGGSSDAAAALRMVASLYGLELEQGRLLELAAGIGADVPFFMETGPQLARGAGEKLTPVDIGFDYSLALVAPATPLATADVYRLYDELCSPDSAAFAEESQRLTESIERLDGPRALAGILHNDLEPVAAKLCPEVNYVKEELLSLGALAALVSGSGPAVFGIFEGTGGAEGAARALGRPRRRTWAAGPWRNTL